MSKCYAVFVLFRERHMTAVNGQRALIDYVTDQNDKFRALSKQVYDACQEAHNKAAESFNAGKKKYAHYTMGGDANYLKEDLDRLQDRCEGEHVYKIAEMVCDVFKGFQWHGVRSFLHERTAKLIKDKKTDSRIQALSLIIGDAQNGLIEETDDVVAKSQELQKSGAVIFDVYQKTPKTKDEIADIKQTITECVKELDEKLFEYKPFENGKWDFAKHCLITKGEKANNSMEDYLAALRDKQVLALTRAVEKLFPFAEREAVVAFLLNKIFFGIRDTYAFNSKLYIHCGFVPSWGDPALQTKFRFKFYLVKLMEVPVKESIPKMDQVKMSANNPFTSSLSALRFSIQTIATTDISHRSIKTLPVALHNALEHLKQHVVHWTKSDVAELQQLLNDVQTLESRTAQHTNSAWWKFKKFILSLLTCLKIRKINPYKVHEQQAHEAVTQFKSAVEASLKTLSP